MQRNVKVIALVVVALIVGSLLLEGSTLSMFSEKSSVIIEVNGKRLVKGPVLMYIGETLSNCTAYYTAPRFFEPKAVITGYSLTVDVWVDKAQNPWWGFFGTSQDVWRCSFSVAQWTDKTNTWHDSSGVHSRIYRILVWKNVGARDFVKVSGVEVASPTGQNVKGKTHFRCTLDLGSGGTFKVSIEQQRQTRTIYKTGVNGAQWGWFFTSYFLEQSHFQMDVT